MNTCYMMIGLPALGKSTFIKNLKTEDNWIYSTDMYIDAIAEDNGITYSEAFESNIAAATAFNEQKLKTILQLGKDVIWDQTNLGLGKRSKIIKHMTKAGYVVKGICLLPPSNSKDNQEWQRRLTSRPGKVIPISVLANMLENFKIPTLEEGFYSLTFYDMYGKKSK